ncbi:MAG: hypothetical protein HC812_19195 [Leptolyngbya sp. RL_3_1]|nr:hypothetical protein [Leptolyngbya sp. RL_3_1]
MSNSAVWPIYSPDPVGLRDGIPRLDDFDAGVYRVLHATPGATLQPPPPAVQTALARLVGVIRTLCTPGQGWPSDRPQTPENLLPYVSDEAEELLDQWQQVTALAGDPPAFEQIHGPILAPDLSCDRPTSDHRPLADLCSACLWGITASSFEAMRYLEGVAATVERSGPWPGVRLAPCLDFESPTLGWSLDIVTQALLTAGMALPDTALIALTADDLKAQPRTGQQWVHRLWQTIEQQQPMLRSLRQGWEIALLLPHQDWCQGRLTLRLKLVGLPQQPPPAPPCPPL